MKKFASRAGEKLCFALDYFKVNVQEKVCADFGSNVGGFVDCLLQNGASKVYAVETGYGVLSWNLRNNSKVIVMERTNAMHVSLPEKVEFVSVDVSWTIQEKILPNALKNLKKNGIIISLVKPHYEASANPEYRKLVKGGKISEQDSLKVLHYVIDSIQNKLNVVVHNYVKSPIEGGKAKNTEYLVYIS